MPCSTASRWRYAYTLQDHLGNTRVLFADADDNAQPELLSEYHYYPFGLPQAGWSGGSGSTYRYQYHGKEWETEFGLGWDDYGARWYDLAVGRWGQEDPLAEKYGAWSPYNYVLGNPISFIDSDRMAPDWIEDGNGNLIAEQHDDAYSLAGHLNISVAEANDMLASQNIQLYAFNEHSYSGFSVRVGAVLDVTDDIQVPGETVIYNQIPQLERGAYQPQTKTWEALTQAQVQATRNLVDRLLYRYDLNSSSIFPHKTVQRKTEGEGQTVKNAIGY